MGIQITFRKTFNVIFQHLLLIFICCMLFCCGKFWIDNRQKTGKIATCRNKCIAFVFFGWYCDAISFTMFNRCKPNLVRCMAIDFSFKRSTIHTVNLLQFHPFFDPFRILLCEIFGQVRCNTFVAKGQILCTLSQTINGFQTFGIAFDFPIRCLSHNNIQRHTRTLQKDLCLLSG